MRWHKQTVTSGGVRLAVRNSGGDGIPAVLVHGLGVPQRSWDRVASLLARHFGWSPTTSAAMALGGRRRQLLEAFLADLQAVLDGLALEHRLLVGHALGGLVAVEQATTRPGCPGVVAVDGGLKVERPPVGRVEVQGQLAPPVTRLLSRGGDRCRDGDAALDGRVVAGG